MNFSSVSVQKLVAAMLFYTEGYVVVWMLNHFFALPINSSIVYFIVLQLVCIWYGIFAISIADMYETRNKTLDNMFYGQKIIVGGTNVLVGILGAVTCIVAFPMIFILINPNRKIS